MPTPAPKKKPAGSARNLAGSTGAAPMASNTSSPFGSAGPAGKSSKKDKADKAKPQGGGPAKHQSGANPASTQRTAPRRSMP